MEWYGFSEYYEHPEKAKRILSVFSCDAVGNFVENGQPGMKVRVSTMLAPSFMDYLLPDIFRRNMKGRLVTTEKGTMSDDTFCADEDLKIPAFWPHVVNYSWHHNAGPGFSEADWDVTNEYAYILGSAVGLLATGGKAEAAAIAGKVGKLAVDELKTQIACIQRDLMTGKLLPVYDAVEKMRYYAEQTAERLLSINRFWPGTVRKSDTAIFREMAEKAIAKLPVPEGPRPLHFAMKEADRMIVRRLVPGPLCSLARVPREERTSSTIIPVTLYMSLDGKRTLFEAVKRYEYENDRKFDDKQIRRFIDHLHYLEKYGYVSIRTV